MPNSTQTPRRPNGCLTLRPDGWLPVSSFPTTAQQCGRARESRVWRRRRPVRPPGVQAFTCTRRHLGADEHARARIRIQSLVSSRQLFIAYTACTSVLQWTQHKQEISALCTQLILFAQKFVEKIIHTTFFSLIQTVPDFFFF